MANYTKIMEKLSTEGMEDSAFHYYDFLTTIFKKQFPERKWPEEELEVAANKIAELELLIE